MVGSRCHQGLRVPRVQATELGRAEDEVRKKGHMDSLTEDAEGYVVATAVGYLRNVVFAPQGA